MCGGKVSSQVTQSLVAERAMGEGYSPQPLPLSSSVYLATVNIYLFWHQELEC